MTSSTEGTMEGLHELLAERSRFEGWLTQLEQRRSTTPLHVLERVRADYSTRLDQVTTQLRGRAVDLEASAAALRSRLAGLASEEEARRDERAETELRASVGEFETDQAASTMAHCDHAIASLTAQRDALGSELAKLQEVLIQVFARPDAPPASAPQPAHAAPPAQASAPFSHHEPDGETVLEPITALAPDPEPAQIQPDDPTPSAVEELEFLRSIVNAPDSHSGASHDGHGDLVPPPVLAAPRRQATPMSTGAIRDPLRTVQGDGSLSPGNMPSYLKDMPTEQVKTLKCQECGTMNYPTEWYCERCGGELAAM